MIPSRSAASDSGRVLICLLGGFRLVKSGRPITLRTGGRSQALLCSLALDPRAIGVPRDELVQSIWPDAQGALGVQALNTLVYSLRTSLRDALDGQGPIVHVEGRYRLNAEAGVRVDFEQFDRDVGAADRLDLTGKPAEAAYRYLVAAGLYKGDLAIGSEVQHVVHRERLRARYLGVRAWLAEYHLALGDNQAALADALDILSCDPCREDAHRVVMRCFVRLGQRAQALRQYHTCRDILAAEFEAAPEAATEELFELVRLAPDLV